MKSQSIDSVYSLVIDSSEAQVLFGIHGSLAVVVVSIEELGKVSVADYLGETEKKQLSSYTYPKRKSEWLAGRIVAKWATLMIENPADTKSQAKWLALEVKSEKHGRPFICEPMYTERTMADISISHSHGIAAGMALRQGRCGVDIQKVVPTVEKVKKRFADPAEEAVVAAFSMAGTGDRPLTLIWTAKEALRKAVGTEVLPGFFDIKVCGARQGLPGRLLGEHMILDCSLMPQQSAKEKPIATLAVIAFFLGEYVLAFTGIGKK